MSNNKDTNKDTSLITGLLLIAIGIIALFVTFFDIELVWSEIGKLWPVLLVIIGVSKIPFNKVLKSILLIIIIIASCIVYYERTKDDDVFDKEKIENIFYDDEKLKESIDIQEFSESYIKSDYAIPPLYASVNIEYGAGKLRLNPPVEELVKATNASNDVQLDFSVEYDGQYADIEFEVHDNVESVVVQNKIISSNHFNLALNESPIYDFDIALGACELLYDFSEYKVSNINIEAGACNIDVKIGSLNKLTQMDISTGVSTIRIGVPKSSACRVECESVMINRGFDGFEKKSHNVYETDNFYKASEEIIINLTGAISDVKIYRY